MLKNVYTYILVLAIIVSSCSKTEFVPILSVTELSVSMNCGTKGYVTDGAFFDTPYEQLHGSASVTPRTMLLSARLFPQSGEQENYLIGEPFDYDSIDGKWHHNPAVYWPLEGQLSFLAVSSLNTLKAIRWYEWNCAEKVTIVVDNSFTQDDILFSSREKSLVSDDVGMCFYHSQAWIQFQFCATASAINKFIIYDVVLNSIYDNGELTIKNNAGEPLYDWSFRKSTKINRKMDDVLGIKGQFVASDTLYLDMLIPEQEKTSYTVHYSRIESPDVIESKIFDLPHENWLAGRKYIYQISFNI